MRSAAALLSVLALVACGQASVPSATPVASVAATSSPAATATPAAVLGLGTFPPIPRAELPQDVAARLQAVIDEAVDGIVTPGLAAAVIVADRGTWAGAAGTADGDAPLDPEAQFGIGSVTKTIVAAQVLRLVESGEVDLDRPIADYLEGIPTNGATVREVLGMRSGIAEGSGDLGVICADLSSTVAIDEIAAVLPDRPQFEAGSRLRYTNANYLLAGLLIEKVTGTTVGRAVRGGVLADPGLERLIYQDEERPTPPLAAPFVVNPAVDPMPTPNQLLDLGDGYLPARCLAATAGPAGGMASDPLTLARWGYLLYGGSVIGPKLLAEMTDFPEGYGLGVHDLRPRFGVPALGHEGTVPGYVAQLAAFPDEGLSIAVLTNTNAVEESELTELAGDLRAVIGP